MNHPFKPLSHPLRSRFRTDSPAKASAHRAAAPFVSSVINKLLHRCFIRALARTQPRPRMRALILFDGAISGTCVGRGEAVSCCCLKGSMWRGRHITHKDMRREGIGVRGGWVKGRAASRRCLEAPADQLGTAVLSVHATSGWVHIVQAALKKCTQMIAVVQILPRDISTGCKANCLVFVSWIESHDSCECCIIFVILGRSWETIVPASTLLGAFPADMNEYPWEEYKEWADERSKRDSFPLQSSPRKNTLDISESNRWKHPPWGNLVKRPSTASSELIDPLRTEPLDPFFWSDINAITAFCSSRNLENHSEHAGNRIPRPALIPAWWVSVSKRILHPRLNESSMDPLWYETSEPGGPPIFRRVYLLCLLSSGPDV